MSQSHKERAVAVPDTDMQCEDTSVNQKRGQPRGSRCQRRAKWRLDGVYLCTQHMRMD